MATPQNRTANAIQVEQRDPQPVLSVRAGVPDPSTWRTQLVQPVR